MTWQKRARIGIAIFAVAFSILVAFTFRKRAAPPPRPSLARTDPSALVESTGGRVVRFNRAQEEVRVEYERQLTYADGTTKMFGVKVATDNRAGGRSFVVSGREGHLGQKESVVNLDGDVTLVASDGFTAKTDHAVYAENDGVVRAAGPVAFSHDRLSGSGVGMTYDKNADILTLLDQAVVHMAADRHGTGAADVASGAATFMRRDKIVRFDRGVKAQHAGQVIDAADGVARLTPDEKRIDTIELHGGAHIAAARAAAGGLQALGGRDVTLKYAADGEALQHALLVADALIQVAGDPGRPGRQITANTIDTTLAADGATPVLLVARDAVTLTFPAEEGVAARTIKAAALDANGDDKRGLTAAQFTGNVEYREKGPKLDRIARSQKLDAALKPGMASIDEAIFTDNVRFADGPMFASAPSIRYVLGPGTLALTGGAAPLPMPHVNNEQIAVDARRIDITLAGPLVKASGDVKSVLQPPKTDAARADTKMPSMLNPDQPVNVTSTDLDYDGGASKATYTGAAQLWQAETSIRGDVLTVDDKRGDLTGAGGVATYVMLEQTDKDKKKERVRSTATSKDFLYEDASRRATYTGDAHVTGAEGDMTADRVELYLKGSSGNELDRAEAFGKVTLREQNRTTTGQHLTYTADDQRYVVTGTPVKIVDECERETIGKTLTFLKATDTVDVDGNGYRTQSKGGGKCP